MMLEHLGLTDAAADIVAAMERVLASRAVLTPRHGRHRLDHGRGRGDCRCAMR